MSRVSSPSRASTCASFSASWWARSSRFLGMAMSYPSGAAVELAGTERRNLDRRPLAAPPPGPLRSACRRREAAGYRAPVASPDGRREPLILVSHRGPVQFARDATGRRICTRGSGGLVTALSGLAGRLANGVWICAALSEEDTAVCGEHHGRSFVATHETARGAVLRMIDIDPAVHHKFYSIVANPLLWFLQHNLWDLSNAPNITANEIDAFVAGYEVVNRRFAEVVVEEVATRAGRAVVMIHDYHLYLVAPYVRAHCPGTFLQHFVHVPWPQPDAWRVLPVWMRESLFTGLLANDIVAFHTERYARNFLLGCQDLLGLSVDFGRLTVDVGERRVAARWYPISVDVSSLEELANSPEVQDQERSLENSSREFLILRVDRTDLSKNVLRGFLAYDQLLTDHPELTGRVTFLALLQPSRQDVDEYLEYADRIRRLVADVNLKHGNTDWQPIDLRFQDSLPAAVAAYKRFHVLMVNSVFDGLNLVAKEAMVVNR